MSYKALLNVLSPKAPILNTQNAILSAPVRHVFMLGTIWYLAQKKKTPLNILEIGSWFGASTLTWGEGLKKYSAQGGTINCVDSWTPWLDTTLNDNEWYNEMNRALDHDIAYSIFQHNIKMLPKEVVCQHMRGKTDNILPNLRKGAFDVVFVDADHAYTAVAKDIRNSMDLVAEGGILAGDDLNLQMHECDKELAFANREKDLIKDPKSGRNMHPGVTVAVAEIIGEVSAWGGFWAMQKVGGEWKKISLKEMPVTYPGHFGEEALGRAKSHFADLTV